MFQNFIGRICIKFLSSLFQYMHIYLSILTIEICATANETAHAMYLEECKKQKIEPCFYKFSDNMNIQYTDYLYSEMLSIISKANCFSILDWYYLFEQDFESYFSDTVDPIFKKYIQENWKISIQDRKTFNYYAFEKIKEDLCILAEYLEAFNSKYQKKRFDQKNERADDTLMELFDVMITDIVFGYKFLLYSNDIIFLNNATNYETFFSELRLQKSGFIAEIKYHLLLKIGFLLQNAFFYMNNCRITKYNKVFADNIKIINDIIIKINTERLNYDKEDFIRLIAQIVKFSKDSTLLSTEVNGILCISLLKTRRWLYVFNQTEKIFYSCAFKNINEDFLGVWASSMTNNRDFNKNFLNPQYFKIQGRNYNFSQAIMFLSSYNHNPLHLLLLSRPLRVHIQINLEILMIKLAFIYASLIEKYPFLSTLSIDIHVFEIPKHIKNLWIFSNLVSVLLDDLLKVTTVFKFDMMSLIIEENISHLNNLLSYLEKGNFIIEDQD